MYSGLRLPAILLAFASHGICFGSSTNPGRPLVPLDVDDVTSVGGKALIRREQAGALPSNAARPASAIQTGQSLVVDAAGHAQLAEHDKDPTRDSEPPSSKTADSELARFMSLLENRIKESWFLHGEPVLVVVDTQPYVVSPSKDTAVKGPQAVTEELGVASASSSGSDTAVVAKAATEKMGIGFALWISDVPSLLYLSKNFDADNVREMSHQGKLRGFLKGEEQSEDSIKKMSKTDLLGFGWSLTWLVGGLGRQGLLGQAAQATAISSEEAGSLLQEAHTSSYYQEMDREWFRSMMRATPTDGVDAMVAAHAKDWLSALTRASA
eukprot:TRINITY_DN35814_c0_g1_i1.p1 TRINITY_DN35814_c0_g1~~TRINITY_DN35814_c0_g1_i1.p1  ORF type:complete len:325 (+),score=77.06 TRINITY_DN35814_c0_g1_i1:71-1045(+)